MVRLRHHRIGGCLGSARFLSACTCLLFLGGLIAVSGLKSTDKEAPDETVKQHETTSIVTKPETSSISGLPLNHDWRSKRALPRFEISDVYSSNEDLGNVRESVKKIPAKDHTTYIIPYMRPGRSMYPAPVRNIDTFDYALNLESKRNKDTMVPMPRFGRTNNQGQASLIPYMRFGRSDEIYNEFAADTALSVKKSGTIIPLVRYGRGSSYIYNPKSQLNRIKEVVNDVNGEYESDVAHIINDDGLSGIPKYYSSEVGVLDPSSTVLLSSKADANQPMRKKASDDKETVIPYPRLGRVSEEKSMAMKQNENHSHVDLKRQNNSNLLLPQIRYGRSMGLIFSKDPSKNRQSSESQNTQEFILPYPRPGRSPTSSSEMNKISSTRSANILLPYPRPGRSNDVDVVSEVHVGKNAGEKRQGYMIPYARLGRSDNTKVLDTLSDIEIMNQNQQNDHDRSFLKKQPKEPNEKLNVGESTAIFIIPYPRPGKREFIDIIESSNQNFKKAGYRNLENELTENSQENENQAVTNENIFDIPHGIQKRSAQSLEDIYVVPYPRPGRSNSNKNENLGFLVPYPRFGRDSDGNFMLPYARLGKKANGDIIPYPRLGRSSPDNKYQYILPYPRFGRSPNSQLILPYPRPGRSDQGDKGQYVLPYPRPGRSENLNLMLPYPRPGRASHNNSQYVLPYLRPGRSETVSTLLPYPRLGRSDTQYMLPYPRLGRSGDTMLPYPRLGRSSNAQDYVLPYPRPGRSENSKYIIPLPRLGRANLEYYIPSRAELSKNAKNDFNYSESGVVSFNDEPIHISKSSGDITKKYNILPYPRIGRSQKQDNQLYVLPYPRLGRSGENSLNDGEEMDRDSVIPYPRLGRTELSKESTALPNNAHKLNKHMLTGNSNYLLPYPRPGRFIK